MSHWLNIKAVDQFGHELEAKANSRFGCGEKYEAAAENKWCGKLSVSGIVWGGRRRKRRTGRNKDGLSCPGLTCSCVVGSRRSMDLCDTLCSPTCWAKHTSWWTADIVPSLASKTETHDPSTAEQQKFDFIFNFSKTTKFSSISFSNCSGKQPKIAKNYEFSEIIKP